MTTYVTPNWSTIAEQDAFLVPNAADAGEPFTLGRIVPTHGHAGRNCYRYRYADASGRVVVGMALWASACDAAIDVARSAPSILGGVEVCELPTDDFPAHAVYFTAGEVKDWREVRANGVTVILRELANAFEAEGATFRDTYRDVSVIDVAALLDAWRFVRVVCKDTLMSVSDAVNTLMDCNMWDLADNWGMDYVAMDQLMLVARAIDAGSLTPTDNGS